MKTESEKGITIPVSKVRERVMAATHVSRSTLYRVLKEGVNVETGVSMAFSTPRKQRPSVCTKSVLDKFDEVVLRRIVHNFYVTEKQRPTLKATYRKMCEFTGYGEGVTSLRLVLRKMPIIRSTISNFRF
jgi:hypothetical protein